MKESTLISGFWRTELIETFLLICIGQMSEFLTNIPNLIKQIDLLLPATYLLWFLEQSLLTYCINCFISLSAYRSQEQYVTAALKLKTSFRICFCCQSFYGLLYFCQLQETRWFYCHHQLSSLFYFFFQS